MRNMSRKTWKLRVWNHMTEMQKLDILLDHDDVEGWLTARQVTKMWRCGNAAQNR